VTVIDHAGIASRMRCIRLPRRTRGAQSAEAKDTYERALSEWCRIIQTAASMDYKIGARDWCYVLEVAGSITKGEFDAAEKLIGACRKDGHLPVDICVTDNGRPTANLESIDDTSIDEEAEDIIARMKRAYLLYRPISFWENQKYYLQMGVEKMGIYSLYEKPTAEFHVPLINLGGWVDINRRVEAMRRFAHWENRGKICVLLIFTDHDPGGLHIAEFVRKNLADLANAVGWAPDRLIIVRFGLDAKFIRRHRLTWIDNLETSSGEQLDDPRHHDHFKDYVQSYIRQFGARKVEANALVVCPEAGRELCRQAILKYVSLDAAEEFHNRLEAAQRKVQTTVRRLLWRLSHDRRCQGTSWRRHRIAD
jgi:hypothetical protein